MNFFKNTSKWSWKNEIFLYPPWADFHEPFLELNTNYEYIDFSLGVIFHNTFYKLEREGFWMEDKLKRINYLWGRTYQTSVEDDMNLEI